MNGKLLCLPYSLLNNFFFIVTALQLKVLQSSQFFSHIENRENLKEEQLQWVEGILLFRHSVSRISSATDCQVLILLILLK